ncbi:hypothetical protein RRG08_021430 [Elysia crispata]|uniref:Uncharacterized protein n=1 Tax=Elysia crispata TaxID=231223 RepID=A0AAE1DSY7_9GAST|nr:hypothetical protein RRG08_021430 [Elysia crispata]
MNPAVTEWSSRTRAQVYLKTYTLIALVPEPLYLTACLSEYYMQSLLTQYRYPRLDLRYCRIYPFLHSVYNSQTPFSDICSSTLTHSQLSACYMTMCLLTSEDSRGQRRERFPWTSPQVPARYQTISACQASHYHSDRSAMTPGHSARLSEYHKVSGCLVYES